MALENWYDEEEDVFGIRIMEREYWKSIELSNGIVIYVSHDGKIIGMEIMGASKIFTGDVRKVIEVAEHK